MLYGVDQVVERRDILPRGARFGLVTNDSATTAVNAQLTNRVVLQRAQVNLVWLFSPEHGITAAAPDGSAVPDHVDALTNLPVVSLYGDRLRPSREMLSDLDGMLIDLPDIGSRFYTFIWTMSYVLEACAEVGLPVWILDRPNPIGGDFAAAEGPYLDEASCSSFLGRFSIPVRHSLTMGELARLWNRQRQLRADLQIVPVAGWRRLDHHPQTGLAFVPPSPAIPNYLSALCYPGICLFEGTNVSAGRGTDFPFQQIGAPWLDEKRLHEEFAALQLPGMTSIPISFVPQATPYRDRHCNGIRLQITDSSVLRPVVVGLALLSLVMDLSKEQFQWSAYPTAVNPSGENHFERLIGRSDITAALAGHRETLLARIRQCTAVPDWPQRVEGCLSYA